MSIYRPVCAQGTEESAINFNNFAPFATPKLCVDAQVHVGTQGLDDRFVPTGAVLADGQLVLDVLLRHAIEVHVSKVNKLLWVMQVEEEAVMEHALCEGGLGVAAANPEVRLLVRRRDALQLAWRLAPIYQGLCV